MIRERDKVIEFIARRICADNMFRITSNNVDPNSNEINEEWDSWYAVAETAYNAFIEYDETRCYGT